MRQQLVVANNSNQPPIEQSTNTQPNLPNSSAETKSNGQLQQPDDEDDDDVEDSSDDQHTSRQSAAKRPYSSAFPSGLDASSTAADDSLMQQSFSPDDLKTSDSDYQPPSIGSDDMPHATAFTPAGLFGPLGALQFLQRQAALLTSSQQQAQPNGGGPAASSMRPLTHGISVKKDLMASGNGHSGGSISSSNGHGQHNGHHNGHSGGSHFYTHQMAQGLMPSPPAQVPTMPSPTPTAHGRTAAPTTTPLSAADMQHQQLMEMQSREHSMRMEVLKWQLQKAKDDCQTAEINKMLAQRRLRLAAAAGSLQQPPQPQQQPPQQKQEEEESADSAEE